MANLKPAHDPGTKDLAWYPPERPPRLVTLLTGPKCSVPSPDGVPRLVMLPMGPKDLARYPHDRAKGPARLQTDHATDET